MSKLRYRLFVNFVRTRVEFTYTCASVYYLLGIQSLYYYV